MPETKLRSYLETATNIAVLSVSVLLLSVFVWSYFAQRPKTQFESGLHKGKILAQLPNINYGSSPRTLLIALSSKCSYCVESMPFYKHVSETQSENRTTHILAVSAEADSAMKQYLAQNQINIDIVSAVDLSAYGISATPTIILLDSNGTVLDFWVGELSQQTEREVIKAITTS